MSSADWTPEPHDTIPELEPDYHAEPYAEAIRWATVQDQLDHATKSKLMELMRGGIGEPDAHT